MARRIADHIAVAVSHERLSKAAGNAASRSSGGAGVDDTVRTVCAEINRKSRTIIVGQSADWQGVLKKAAQVAATDTTVLVSGESGTGKEVVARFIHQASARKSGPFVALNCAALPEQLLEAELFGYERGAFTGAQQAKPGQIELAAGGVLFLDEVSEMSLAAQAKFLRVLQEREFQRLGGTRLLKANIRVVAATNRDLRQAVERGDFREDLFYRLQVFDIHIPPLRERRADILPLSEAFLQELGRSFARPPAGLTREAREALLRTPGRGTSANCATPSSVRRSCARTRSSPHSICPWNPSRQQRHADLGTMERETIAKVLRDCRWNKSDAARRLGLSRTQLRPHATVSTRRGGNGLRPRARPPCHRLTPAATWHPMPGRSPIPADGDQRDVVGRLESGAPGLHRLQNARQQLRDLTARGGAQIDQPRKSEFFVVAIARLDHPVGV